MIESQEETEPNDNYCKINRNKRKTLKICINTKKHHMVQMRLPNYLWGDKTHGFNVRYTYVMCVYQPSRVIAVPHRHRITKNYLFMKIKSNRRNSSSDRIAWIHHTGSLVQLNLVFGIFINELINIDLDFQ